MDPRLKDIPLFSGIDDSRLEVLSDVARKKTYPKNTVLCSEGDIGESLYIICRGKVKVTMNDDEGKEIILSMLGPGEYFGEMALLDREPRSATVITKEPTEVMIITRKDFLELFSPNAVELNLLKGLTKRLREANRKIESLALLDVYGRIARLLNQLAKARGDVLVVDEKLTHQEIAKMIGSSREMVSIILKELSTGGFISIDKKQITIHKKLPCTW